MPRAELTRLVRQIFHRELVPMRRQVKLAEAAVQSYGGLTTVTEYHLIPRQVRFNLRWVSCPIALDVHSYWLLRLPIFYVSHDMCQSTPTNDN